MSTLGAHPVSEPATAPQQHLHHHAVPLPTDLKRKRSPSHDMLPSPAPLSKAAKTHNHLQINYLARQLDGDLPLLTNDDTLPNILSLLGDYQGVLDRHESMACNLGARPLGPILIKRFERLFDGPPRLLKSHGKEGATITWLDVVEFARSKPDQFRLGQVSEGVRVCQFYTKQCRVQISEEDFVLISSGIPQKMIPPQPIIEDEEKELGTIDIVEKNLGQICQLADQVAARTRQLNHRLKGRKQAILDRRATASPAPPLPRPSSPSNVALMNGTNAAIPSPQPPLSQTSLSGAGFVAVNSRPQHEPNSHAYGASSTARHELLSKFHTMGERRPSSHSLNGSTEIRRPSLTGSHAIPHPCASGASVVPRAPPKTVDPPSSTAHQPSHPNDPEVHSLAHSAVPIPNTPALLPANSQRASQPPDKDDGGPFKTEMVHRVEALAKGERILPPCDRCRRLHMDCLKNLTACMGCTKKHAKCSWREVTEGELRTGFSFPPASNGNVHSETSDHESGDRASTASPVAVPSPQRHVPTVPLLALNKGPAPVQSHQLHERLVVSSQLQEAAQSGLAHAGVTRTSGAEGQSNEYQSSNQAMVA